MGIVRASLWLSPRENGHSTRLVVLVNHGGMGIVRASLCLVHTPREAIPTVVHPGTHTQGGYTHQGTPLYTNPGRLYPPLYTQGSYYLREAIHHCYTPRIYLREAIHHCYTPQGIPQGG